MERPHARRTSVITMPAPGLTLAGARHWGELLRVLTTTFKLRIGVAVSLSALAGALVALGTWPEQGMVLVLVTSVLLASCGAAGCNHYFERDIDARMLRTRGRPFVTGALGDSRLWLAFFVMLMAGGSGLAAWRFGWLSGSLVLAGALTYAVIYTLWLKRRTQWNIVIGGLAGSWAVLAGAAIAPDPAAVVAPAVLLLALVLYLWTPSHFWSLSIAMSEDYRRAAVPMLPVTHGVQAAAGWTLVNTLALAAAALWLAVELGQPLVWAGVLGGTAYLLAATWSMYRRPHAATAFGAFRASLVQLLALLAGILAAAVMI
jgi:heme o synthase